MKLIVPFIMLPAVAVALILLPTPPVLPHSYAPASTSVITFTPVMTVYLPAMMVPSKIVVERLDTIFGEVSGEGLMFITGAVRNNTSQKAHWSTGLILYDAQGNVFATWLLRPLAGDLKPGQRSCFWIVFAGYQTDWTHFKFIEITPTLEAVNYTPQKVSLIEVGVKEITRTILYGKARNDESNPVESIRLISALYDDTGRIISCNGTLISNEIMPGEAKPFEIHHPYKVPWLRTHSYEVQIDD